MLVRVADAADQGVLWLARLLCQGFRHQSSTERHDRHNRHQSAVRPLANRRDGAEDLASGKNVAMRLWEAEQPAEAKEPSSRDYETVGYVISGRAELHLEGQMVLLEPGDSWVVPKGASHAYKITEAFTAIEATYPPAQVHGRDEE